MSIVDEVIREKYPDSTACILLHVDRHPDTLGKPWHLNYGVIEDRLLHHPQVVDSAVDLAEDIVYIALVGDCYDVDELIQLDGEFRTIINRCVSLAIN